METLLSIVVGFLVALSVYLMLRRNLVRFLFGLILLSNAANLAIFTAGGLRRGAPALIAEGAEGPTTAMASSVPQALILTAIVISFGLLSYALVLAWQSSKALGTVDTDAMRAAEPKERDVGGGDS